MTVSENKSIVLVCIDCLRSDLFFQNEARTPFINRIAADETAYRNLHTSANTTTPAVASLLTGLYSEKNGVPSLRESELDEDVDTLAEVLSEQGYDTYAAVTGPLSTDTGLDRGFQNYHYRNESKELHDGVLEEVVDWIESVDDPFFAYIHLWELHSPIEVRKEYDDESYGRCAYERKLSELDHELKRLVDRLDEDCMIAITGDHGEAFTWRGTATQFVLNRARRFLRFNRGIDTRGMERAVNRFLSKIQIDIHDHPIENGHGESVHDFVSEIPLVIIDDDLPGNTFDQQCRHVDIYPTLINLISSIETRNIDGNDLSPPATFDPRPVYIRSCGMTLGGRKNWSKAIRADGYKLIRYPDREWDDELYDLEADPTEMSLENDKAVVQKLESEFPTANLKRVRELDNEGQLKRLGYL